MKLKAHVDAQLSQAQLEELAGRLTDKRRELTERVDDLERQIVVKDDCSLADAALRRLAHGSYGVSEITREPIAFDRLLLIPWARTGADDRE